MFAFLDPIKVLFNNLCQLIDENTKPNPKYHQEATKFAVAHNRNKTGVFANLLLIFYFIINMIFGGKDFIAIELIRILMCLILIGIHFISFRLHPQVFNGLINLIVLAYGPVLIGISDQSLFKAYSAAQFTPSLVYLYTGSPGHLLFQSIMQFIYSNLLYKKMLLENVMFMTPEAFSQAFSHAFNLAIVSTCILVVVIYSTAQNANKRIAIVEKKKDEVENQKTFLLGFSHELRNLINSLTGNVKLAGLETLTTRAKELLLNAEVCGELLLHLVNNILDTGKVEIGELEINPTATRTYDVIERIWGVCSELIRQKDLFGKVNIPKDLPRTVMVDQYRLTQIFLNLVGNAVKFTEKGFIEVSVSWIDKTQVDEECFQPYPYNYQDDHDEGLFEKQNVLSSLDKNIITLDIKSRKINHNLLTQPIPSRKGVIKVSITDTGCGMTEQETSKLFQKFTQVSADANKRKLGTGLGLFITKQLCQRMNGETKVYSRKDKGSSFVVCIPVNTVQGGNDVFLDHPSSKELLKSRKFKALIVDDTPFNNAVVKSFFDKLDIEVIGIALNGLEAYEKYTELTQRGIQPDIITMDLDMPVMDGKEATIKIRDFELENGLRPSFVSIISGNCTESEINECLVKYGEVKADSFLKKPASLEQILRAIEHHFFDLKKV